MIRSSLGMASRAAALLFADTVSWLVSIVVALGFAVVTRGILTGKLGLPVVEDVPSIVLIFVSAFVILNVRSWSLGHYSQFRPFWVELKEVFTIVLWIAAFISFLLFVIGITFSRLWFGYFLIVSFILVPVGREFVKMRMIKSGIWHQNTLIVGIGSNAVDTALALESDSSLGSRVVGFIDLKERPEPLIHMGNRPVFTSVEAALEQFRTGMGAKIVFAFETIDELNASKTLMDRFIASSTYISVVPPKLELPLYGAEMVGIFRHDTTLLRMKNNLIDARAQFIKRSFDLIVSILILIIALPFFIVLGFLIKRDGGPVFFKHTRLGRGGTKFECLKFRSMVVNAEDTMFEHFKNDPAAEADWLQRRKLKDDPRITKIGAYLRRSSLDELPQLLNVLKGEMSLIGPRPIVDEEKLFYGKSLVFYDTMTPGMTGLWQVSGRTETTYAERVRLDVWYSRNWSLWNDFVILVQTVKTVIKRHGAY